MVTVLKYQRHLGKNREEGSASFALCTFINSRPNIAYTYFKTVTIILYITLIQHPYKITYYVCY